MSKKITERQEAILLANKILERPNADPDDDLALLSRQFLREVEKSLESYDPMKDLIHSNRDEVLKKHEEAICLIRQCMDVDYSSLIVMENRCRRVISILNALSTFHPMHGESWKGFPKEGDNK